MSDDATRSRAAYLVTLARSWADELDDLAKAPFVGAEQSGPFRRAWDRGNWTRTVRGKMQGAAYDFRRMANALDSKPPPATPDRAAEPFYTGHMAGLDAARAFVGALGRGSAQSLDANLLNVADNSDAIRWLRRALLERLGNA